MEALGFKISQFVGIMGDKAVTEGDRELSGQAVNKHMKKVLEKLRSATRTSFATDDKVLPKYAHVVRDLDVDIACEA